MSYSFTTPVQARYLRLRATQNNPGGQWVKIREFEVRAPVRAYESNLAALDGQGPSQAFDADLSRAYRAASQPVDGSYLARNFDAAQTVGTVRVVGTAAGSVQELRNGTWTTVGQLDPAKVFNEAVRRRSPGRRRTASPEPLDQKVRIAISAGAASKDTSSSSSLTSVSETPAISSDVQYSPT